MPAAYMIAQIDITDQKAYDEYKVQVPPTLAPYGGEFVVRGGTREVMEGETPYTRVVVIKFPSMAKAKEWHSSEIYAAPKALRQSASKGLLMIVEGA